MVGIDGSPGAQAALAWAFDEAHRRAGTLVAVSVWHIPASVLPMADIYAALSDAAQSVLAGALAEATGGDSRGEPPGGIERHILEGNPSAVLLEQARDAALLVVGSRGLGGFSGLLLGSVSQHCAHHARCPLVIVPAPG